MTGAGPAAVQHVADQAQIDLVVGHQPVAALHQCQRGFALAHAAGPLDQHAHPEHLQHVTVHLRGRREHEGQNAHHARGELGGGQRRLQHRPPGHIRQAQKVVGGVDAVGKHAAGKLIRDHLAQRRSDPFRGELLQVGALAPAKHLDALPGEAVEEAAQGEAGTVQLRSVELRRQPAAPADASQIQRLVLLRVKAQQVENGYPMAVRHRRQSRLSRAAQRGADRRAT